ncbi:MAG: 50S ribosomal protein L11 methyltransferase [Alphaproteobacteria bacterium]|nr:50S ribosomal protein L11 methyltransferase [Alphaproteobacteria bacterium]
MNNNLSSCTIITFEPLETISEDLVFFLDEYFDVTACNYTDDGKEEYVGYAGLDFDDADFVASDKISNVILPTYKIEVLKNKNWLTENVIKFDPIETDDFLIYGIHEKQVPITNKPAIKIYAATAFGSGHQTTKSCLNAISDLNKQNANHKHILDMGTGSGILALACAKIWGDDNLCVTAVDIDDESVRVTTQNAFDNNLEQFLNVAQSDGYNSKIVQQNAPYDIILSNILARPLIEMAPLLYKHLKTGGYCVLSGFIDEQVDWVIDAHKQQGLSVVKIYNIDNWYAVLMEKK